MLIQSITFLCAIHLVMKQCKCLKLVDLPSDSDNPEPQIINEPETRRPYPPVKSTPMKAITYPPTKQSEKDTPTPPVRPTIKEMTYTSVMPAPLENGRRFMQSNYKHLMRQATEMNVGEDTDLKVKIGFLIEQTLHDTQKKIKSVQKLKEQAREEGPYKAGFLLSLIKRSRTVLNDLFNLAIKHRDSWKALEQLKIFEFIVHVNVDTTNLIRQLVEIHLQNLEPPPMGGRRVVRM
ncbi:uncharacterized protein LOC142978536 [Anticarsia gemmatalis]|uniref:uncharacterized protein LOC142978536 n=1 Tax=Anticarsia gemmatalis TaxID=129554 RepID=UPI003F76BAF8